MCDDMQAGLREMQARLPFDIKIIDVDSDPILGQRYGELVPVLAHADHELCRYHLDPAAITDYLLEFR